MTQDIDIYVMPTPNPNAVKFVLEESFFESGSYNFPSKEKAELSKFATNLFEIEGVAGVMIGTNFVSVTKSEDAQWEALAESLRDTIKTNVIEKVEVVDQKAWAAMKEAQKGESGDIENRIIEILDNEIRPAVAMDGGDIQFHSFEDGIVYVHLQGACSTCPSSTMTLKMGIENRLKEDIPEIEEVMQV